MYKHLCIKNFYEPTFGQVELEVEAQAVVLVLWEPAHSQCLFVVVAAAEVGLLWLVMAEVHIHNPHDYAVQFHHKYYMLPLALLAGTSVA